MDDTQHKGDPGNTLSIDRRCFIKWSALAGSSILTSGSLLGCFTGTRKPENILESSVGTTQIIRTGCPAHNCGGRCLLHVHVKEGTIIRIETDDRPDQIADPQLRACIRGRAYRGRQYHKERLLYPLKRIGKRGKDEFQRISWAEALDLFAEKIVNTIEKYGNSALFVPYGTGSYNQINGRQTAQRLFNLLGGSLGYYNSYSWACISQATPYMFGTGITGNQRQDWLNSKYIIMWSWNPAEMRDGTNSEYFLKKARENGARIVCIDPRMTMSAVALSDEWIPIRPGTDVAMMSAMAHTIISHELHDKDFVAKYCIGFDRSNMPAGLENEESYQDYIMGNHDGVAKTAEWAETITGIPAPTIRRIAIEFATTKPSMLYQGYGMQRRAYGEQAVLAGCALAVITGNIGIEGGWASGMGLQAKDGGPFWNVLPTGPNNIKATIPTFLWTEAIIRGKGMDKSLGVRGIDKLDNDIKLLWSVASNILINQHSNVNRSAEILGDESLVEFIVVQDQFLTPSAKYADLVLPVATQFETWGLEDGWKYGDEVILMPKLVEPPGETKSDYQIAAELADRFNMKDRYTEGKSERDWIDWAIVRYQMTRFPGLPDLDQWEAENTGVYSTPVKEPEIAFSEFREDPDRYPLNTPSGKIELFSERLLEMNDPDHIPAVPKYIQEWESPFGPEVNKYPLQALGHHYMGRVHSTHANNSWTNEAFPHVCFINPIDAKNRALRNGDRVKVYNDRGALLIPCRITRKIRPGVVDIPQGAWWDPDEEGNDLGGNINVLTSERWTPLAFGNAQHTIMVEIKKHNSIA